MPKRLACILVSGWLLGWWATGCATKVEVPPRVDLERFGTLGIARFEVRSASAGAASGAVASREFVSYIHRGQPGTPVLEVRQVSAGDLQSPAAVRAFATEHGVDSVVIGSMDLAEVKPKVSVNQFLTEGSIEATLRGGMQVSILEGKSGATLWSSSTRANESVAHIGIDKNVVTGTTPNASIGDVETARDRLIRTLAYRVTSDFRARWVKQR